MKTDQLNEIVNFIVYKGGICPTDDNHFGGDPNANAPLKLKIQQRPAELASLIQFFLDKKAAGEKLEYYAEIGACSGGTTYAINEFLKFKELLVIDDGGAESIDFYVNQRGDQLRGQNLKTIPRIELIGHSADSRVVDMAMHIASKQQYDILFIDGDHSYEGVKNDTLNYLDLVRSGGYFVFHDTNHIEGIFRWLTEINSYLPQLKMIESFCFRDPYTDKYENGIGLTVYQKV